ncbi:sugar dehydrogenase complex small subunit [Roseateles chitosanitabidus]|uniref:sugar dehydrogenase complex small subunit n=1 Tax=Roseateles chitosanitabidus TaxID=65048 RepID=UPI0008344EE0|nr:sugar dehydrogenase complex small subunit [Roseateles chitosanitabidus]
MTHEHDPSQALSRSLSRRSLLEMASLAGTALALGGAGLLAAREGIAATASAAGDAAALPAADFLRLSVFLTGGQPLDATLAGRYQAALAKRDPQFGDSARALLTLIASSQAASIDQLLEAPELKDTLRALTTRIVSAWYLGIVGQDADAELISYAEALMYRPTKDVLVVPTYGAGPDSWGEQPASSATAPTSAPATAPISASNERKSS